MTNEKAKALKQTVDALAQEGDQWLLEEPLIWEKQKQWAKGDVVPYPYVSDFSPSKESIAAGAAIDSLIKGSPLDNTFVSVYRQGDMMVLSVPEMDDIMIPFTKNTQVWLSRGIADLYCPGHVQAYYDIYPETKLWVNAEEVELWDKQALVEAELQVCGSWATNRGIAFRCVPKADIICIRQEGRGRSVHGPVWADPTCIFYKV